MVRGAGLVGFAMLSVDVVTLALALTPCDIFLLEGAMPLLLQVTFTVAVEAARGVKRLAIHSRERLLEASAYRNRVRNINLLLATGGTGFVFGCGR